MSELARSLRRACRTERRGRNAASRTGDEFDLSNLPGYAVKRRHLMRKQLIGLAIAAAFALPAAAEESVEVLHWWTSGGEAAALNVLKGNLEKQGVKWNDMPVAGGGGEHAMTAVRARVTSGNPPTAVQMLGFDILDWDKQGVLADLNTLATKDGWDKTIPTALQKFSKYNDKWIAAPVNVHSTNWVWANKAVLAKAGVTSEPKTWDEFIAAAEKV